MIHKLLFKDMGIYKTILNHSINYIENIEIECTSRQCYFTMITHLKYTPNHNKTTINAVNYVNAKFEL